MSKYQPLYSSIWSDDKFENYSSNKKLLFIFLLTNQFVEKSGIYKISIRQICFYTGLTNDVINDVINELINEGKIQYDFDNSVIFVKKLFHYQRGVIKNENILLLTIKRNYELVKTSFWDSFFDTYSNESIITKIKDLLINESLMAHQLYINKNKNKNKGKGKSKNKNTNNKEEIIIKEEETINLIESQFQELWKFYQPIKTKNGYTAKGNKEKARSAFKKALNKHSFEKIMKALENYLKYCSENGRFTKNVSTWLNESDFEQEEESFIIPTVKNDKPQFNYQSIMEEFENE